MRWTLASAALACAVMPTLSTRPLVAQDLRASQVEIELLSESACRLTLPELARSR